MVENNKVVLNTTIDKDVKDAFNTQCKQVGFSMNTVLEILMRQFANGEFRIKFEKNKLDLDLEE
jgi:antitoxin component of RelBE/YafQ-DinJ toxin-antitoxin module|nr:MAG TPA: antitoxin [Caudoviricetes sp.]